MIVCALLLAAPEARAARTVSAEPVAPALLHQVLDVVVKASGGEASGVRLSFPDLQGSFMESACRIGAVARTAGSPSAEFAVPYRPGWAGLHLLELAVTSGGCGADRTLGRVSVPVEVSPSDAPRAAGAPEGGCVGADLLPLRGRMRALRLAVVCLVNRERAAAGVAPLRTTARLRAAASRHAHELARQSSFGHAGRRGGLAARLRSAGVRARAAGENLGAAPGRLGTPRSMVAAWMASDPLRRNLVDPAFRAVGVAAVATVGEYVRRAGGLYVLDLVDPTV